MQLDEHAARIKKLETAVFPRGKQGGLERSSTATRRTS
jgi:hypothetical protein